MRNRVLNLWVLIGGLALTGGLLSAQEKEAYRLKPNEPIPGPFQALSVVVPATTLKPVAQPNRFHCPVCEYRLNPAVLIFARQLDEADESGMPAPLTRLLRKLDGVVDKHPDAELGICAVFNDGGYMKLIEKEIDDGAKADDQELTKAIRFKDVEKAKLEKLAKSADLKHVALSLGSPSNYQVPPNTEVRVLFYQNHLAISDTALAKEKLTDAEIDKIVKELEARLEELKKGEKK